MKVTKSKLSKPILVFGAVPMMSASSNVIDIDLRAETNVDHGPTTAACPKLDENKKV